MRNDHKELLEQIEAFSLDTPVRSTLLHTGSSRKITGLQITPNV